MYNTSKIYFTAGDVVTIKHDISNKPAKMLVIKTVKSMIQPKKIKGPDALEEKNKGKELKGIKCIWFTTNGELQEYTFNTKDLVKL